MLRSEALLVIENEDGSYSIVEVGREHLELEDIMRWESDDGLNLTCLNETRGTTFTALMRDDKVALHLIQERLRALRP